MILGADHIALSCASIETTVQGLQPSGWTARFIEPQLPNAPAKQPFLRTFAADHGIAYCTADEGIAIELTRHGPGGLRSGGGYRVLLSGPPAGLTPATGVADPWSAVWSRALGGEARRAAWPGVPAVVWYRTNQNGSAGQPTIAAVMLGVSDLDRAIRFWRSALGVQVIDQGDAEGRRWIHVQLPSVVRAWRADVVLAEQPEVVSASLDDEGFPCLALLSSDVRADSARLLREGAQEETGTFELPVNGRCLSVNVLRGPSAEVIELIEVRRTPRSQESPHEKS